MIRFHVISGEVTDQLAQRVNAWVAEREDANPTHFRIVAWQVSHDDNFIYWTVQYTE